MLGGKSISLSGSARAEGLKIFLEGLALPVALAGPANVNVLSGKVLGLRA